MNTTRSLAANDRRRRPRMAPTSKTNRRRFRAAVEAVEPRALPASTAATFAIVDVPAGTVAVRLDATTFHAATAGKVLVTIIAEGPNGATQDQAPIMVQANAAKNAVRVLARHTDAVQSVAIAALGTGRFTVQAGTDDDGPTRFRFRLAGDLNGDFRVDARDLHTLRELLRTHAVPDDLATADVNGDGRITRDDLTLAQRNQGAHTNVRPLDGTAELDTASDPNHDGVVVTPGVTVRGRATTGTTVQLVSGGGAHVAPIVTTASNGTFLATTSVPMGDSTVYALLNDRFGQATTRAVTVLRRDLTIDWANALLDAVRDTKGNPPASARQMAILGVAMYDAVDSIDRTFAPYGRFVAAPAGASREAAAAVAAHDVLVALVPTRAATFDALLAASLADLPDGKPKTDGTAVGQASAAEVLALRAKDGSGNTVAAPVGDQPGQWRPTPPAFLPPLLPGWGDVTPFVLTSATQFRIPAPPALGSPEYADAVNEVEQVGSATSTTRTAEETNIARFWADAAGTSTPPGHWFRIAADVAAQHDNSIAQNARMFALVGMALADAAVTCWNDKYDVYLWRPVTAIRLADQDGNSVTTADPAWLSLLTTPNFPSDSSGHSTFSAAAATVLASLFGTDQVTFTTTAEGFAVPARTFTSFSQAAYEAGRSRVLGGIHFTFENLAGRQVGTALGQYVADHALQPLATSPTNHTGARGLRGGDRVLPHQS